MGLKQKFNDHDDKIEIIGRSVSTAMVELNYIKEELAILRAILQELPGFEGAIEAVNKKIATENSEAAPKMDGLD